MSLIKIAKQYKKNKFSIIPTDENKRPTVSSWKPYQTTPATDEEIDTIFTNTRVKGIAVICGKVSNNLEVIDIDCKYDVTGTLYSDFVTMLKDNNEQLYNKLLIAKTVNGGYHVYYRCETIQGNQKLASRPSTQEEITDNPHDKVKVLLETRGEGGYVIAYPTNGYEFIQGKVSECPTITADERECLLELSRSFNQYYEQPVQHSNNHEGRNFSISPFDDYNERGNVVELLQRHGWMVVKDTTKKVILKRPGATSSKTSGDYNRELGWFSVFTTSSIFEPNKAYKPYAVFAMLECRGDYSAAAKKLLEQGYGRVKKQIDKKYEQVIRSQKADGKDDKEIAEFLHSHLELTKEQATGVVKDFNANSGEQIRTFWDVNPKNMKINIVRYKLEKFLTNRGGFFLYFYDKQSNIFKVIKNDNGLIDESSTEQIKKVVKNYILSLPGTFDDITREDLLEAVYKGSGTYFSDAFFEFIEPAEIEFLKDTADSAYFPFKNGVVEVTKKGAALKTYGELKKSIWNTQVINHKVDIFPINNLDEVEFYKFIREVCNNEPKRFEYVCSMIGYLLHKFKDTTKPYCVILCEETEDEKKGGGTGKGIFIKAISHLINTEQVDGKNFKLDKTFAFQRVKLDTKLVAIQDIRKNVDFEGFYSIITEGMTIERKNKDELYIPYADSPKIVFTTNYTITSNSNHARRRQRIIEFGQFFTPDYTPLDYFGHRLFEDWDNDQWNKFYNFMFWCVQAYLNNGIPELESSTTVKNKQVKLSYGEEFFDWFNGYLDGKAAEMCLFSDLYNDFLQVNEYEKKDFTQKKFKSALESAANTYGLNLISNKNRTLGNKCEVWIKEKRFKSGEEEKNRVNDNELDFK